MSTKTTLPICLWFAAACVGLVILNRSLGWTWGRHWGMPILMTWTMLFPCLFVLPNNRRCECAKSF